MLFLIIAGVILTIFALVSPKAFNMFAAVVLGTALGGTSWSIMALLFNSLINPYVFVGFMVGGVVAAAYVIARAS